MAYHSVQEQGKNTPDSYSTSLDIVANAMIKSNKSIQNIKGEIKYFLFADEMTVYVENLKNSEKKKLDHLFIYS